MDDLTRLILAARDGDRTALFHAVRENQADVWRLAAHLVGRDDCSYAEAASICSVPVVTIRSRLARARERLLVQLREADTA